MSTELRIRELRRPTGVVYFIPLSGRDTQDVEHLEIVLMPEPSQEATLRIQLGSEVTQQSCPRVGGHVRYKYENLEPGVRGKQVMNVRRFGVRRVNEDVGHHALADNQLGGACLVLVVDYDRGRVPNTNSTGKAAELLEHPTKACST